MSHFRALPDSQPGIARDALAAGLAALASLLGSTLMLMTAGGGVSSADSGMAGGLRGIWLAIVLAFAIIPASAAATCAVLATRLGARFGRPAWGPILALLMAAGAVIAVLGAGLLILFARGEPFGPAFDGGVWWQLAAIVIGPSALGATGAWILATGGLTLWITTVLQFATAVRRKFAARIVATQPGMHSPGYGLQAFLVALRRRWLLLPLLWSLFACALFVLLGGGPVLAPWEIQDPGAFVGLRMLVEPWLAIAQAQQANLPVLLVACALGGGFNLALPTWLVTGWMARRRS